MFVSNGRTSEDQSEKDTEFNTLKTHGPLVGHYETILPAHVLTGGHMTCFT